MVISEEYLDALQRLSDACGPGGWVSLIEGRDLESGSDFIQVNGGNGQIGDIEISLIPGRGSTLEYPRVGRDVITAYQDLIAAARTSLPELIAEIRRLNAELERSEKLGSAN
jgi:hypothetical protein